ncbi:MAG: ATP-binding protein [Roseibium sp.]|nr:ATP-binding protein [Roseibium sp.]
MSRKPTLHLLCGKVAAGKSTLAKSLSSAPDTVLLQEDHWLSGLYAEELKTLKDYVSYSTRLRDTLHPHIVDLLKSGLSVVLDFQANTLESRQWMRKLFEEADCEHQLHVLDTPDDTCKTRLRARNASGAHEFQVSDEQFDKVSAFFQRPTGSEGFNIRIHEAG